MFNINEVVGCIARFNHSMSMKDMQDSDLTNLKLQKLLYYAQGHYIAEFKQQLFINDIVAWKHGPVITSIYYTFQSYAPNFIGFDAVNDSSYDCINIINDKECFNFFERLMNYYNKYSPWGLRNMTHEEKPWQKTENNEIISIDLLRDFFEQEQIMSRIS